MNTSDRPPTLTAASLREPGLPILIVDDNREYASLLKRILEGAFGYNNITFLEEISQARHAIQQNPERFKLLFIDHRFPSGETGGALLEQLSNESLMKGKIAFLITCEPSPRNITQATNAGAVGVVAKPFNRDDIYRQIEKAEKILLASEQDYF